MKLDAKTWEWLGNALQTSKLELFLHRSDHGNARGAELIRARARRMGEEGGFRAIGGANLEEAMKNIAKEYFFPRHQNAWGVNNANGELAASSPLDDWILRGNEIRASWDAKLAGWWMSAVRPTTDVVNFHVASREVSVFVKGSPLAQAMDVFEAAVNLMLTVDP